MLNWRTKNGGCPQYIPQYIPKEAWCVRDAFSKLGSILLNRGGTARLDHFLDWYNASFDSYSECHAMFLAPKILDHLISEINRRSDETNDNVQKKKLEMARNLFIKHKSGNPLQGMTKVKQHEIGELKIIDGSETLYDKFKRIFKRR